MSYMKLIGANFRRLIFYLLLFTFCLTWFPFEVEIRKKAK